MTSTPLQVGVAALLAVAVLSGCGRSSTTSSDDAATTTTTVAPTPEAMAAAEADAEDATIPLDFAHVDPADPAAVAQAWGCAYWAHPRGETPERWMERLAPLATPDLVTALGELRISDFGLRTVEVGVGMVDEIAPDRWVVHCATTTLGADHRPEGPAEPVQLELTLQLGRQGWTVAGLAHGPDGTGLALP